MPSVSLQHAAAQALAAVQRAQALFGPHAHAPATLEPSLSSAVRPLATAGQQASTLSGALVNNHRSFVDATTHILEGYDAADRRLHQLLVRAAAVVQHGRAQLDAIVARTRALAAKAMSTRDPGAGRALLQALRNEVSQANSVVTATKAQASGIAGQIRALDYRTAGGSRDFREGIGPDGGPWINDGSVTDPREELPPDGGSPYDLGATIAQDDGKGLIITGDPETGQPSIIINGKRVPLNFPVGPNERALVTGTAVGPDGHRYAFFSIKPYGDDQTPGAFIGENSHVIDLDNPGVDMGPLRTMDGRAIAQGSGVYDPKTNRMYVVGNQNGNGPRTLYSAPVTPGDPNGWTRNLTQVNTFGGMNGNRESQIAALPGGKGFMMVGAMDGQPITAAVASTPEGLLTAAPKVVSPPSIVPGGTDGGTPYGPTVVSITPTQDGQLQVTQRMSVWPDPQGWAAAHPPGDRTPKPYHPKTYTNTFTIDPGSG
jgi:hypothetical protein